jgi:hypothetical protein
MMILIKFLTFWISIIFCVCIIWLWRSLLSGTPLLCRERFIIFGASQWKDSLFRI